MRCPFASNQRTTAPTLANDGARPEPVQALYHPRQRVGCDVLRPRIEGDLLVTGLPIEHSLHSLFPSQARLVRAVLLHPQTEWLENPIGRAGRTAEEFVGQHEDVCSSCRKTPKMFHVFRLASKEPGLVQNNGSGLKFAEFRHGVEAMNTERQRAEDADQRSQGLVVGGAVEWRIAKDQITKARWALLELQGDLATPNPGVTLERHRGEVLPRLVGADLERPGQSVLPGLPWPLKFNPVRHGTVGAGCAVPSLGAVVSIT
jgi:hypothetical protein